ncbi:hypothetical protein cyc_07362 [Cyclospora cayetanensis]|uniref:Uncharacterized protein n=1 Tax=Cyclospora cayetanensis TaxID=88456 RepID=A0A1D3CVP8_9EIME|nr:hypothetical protein cyc_07362 [Cyclospora cayetanensis]
MNPSAVRGPFFEVCAEAAADERCCDHYHRDTSSTTRLLVPQQQQELRRRVKPLVRFGECDVTFNHQGPLHNSRMMRAYSVGCSPEVQRFLRLLKHWVKRRDVG